MTVAKSAMHLQQQSRLMLLPPELRLEIYSHLLPNVPFISPGNAKTLGVQYYGSVPTLQFSRKTFDDPVFDGQIFLRHDKVPCQVSILGVCRQIYDEAVAMLYKQPTFEIAAYTEWGLVMMNQVSRNAHLDRLPKALRRIRKLHLTFHLSLEMCACAECGPSDCHDNTHELVDLADTRIRGMLNDTAALLTRLPQLEEVTFGIYHIEYGHEPENLRRWFQSGVKLCLASFQDPRGLVAVHYDLHTSPAPSGNPLEPSAEMVEYLTDFTSMLTRENVAKHKEPLTKVLPVARQLNAVATNFTSMLEGDGGIAELADQAWRAADNGDLDGVGKARMAIDNLIEATVAALRMRTRALEESLEAERKSR